VPVVIAVGLLLLLPVLFVILLPLSLLLRYRAGTARRPVRGWIVTTNIVSFALSTGLYLMAAAVTSVWVPDALRATLAGLVAGGLVGLLGVATTRWEAADDALLFTPNRWLVLTVMLVVAARLLYGFWRAWDAWWSTPQESSWLAAAGLPGSLAAGGLVIGYALTYWAGVRGKLLGHRRARSRRGSPG
jgi:hypothetical protein